MGNDLSGPVRELIRVSKYSKNMIPDEITVPATQNLDLSNLLPPIFRCSHVFYQIKDLRIKRIGENSGTKILFDPKCM